MFRILAMKNFLKKTQDKLKDLLEAVTFLMILPFIFLYMILKFLYSLWLRLSFYCKWIKKGKNIIFVYSDSPNWKIYVEENILPKLESSCITLNWSERSKWKDDNLLESRIFYHWGGYNDYNPMAIIFISFFKVKTVRFYEAFKEYKHGKDVLLNQRLQELFDIACRNKV